MQPDMGAEGERAAAAAESGRQHNQSSCYSFALEMSTPLQAAAAAAAAPRIPIGMLGRPFAAFQLHERAERQLSCERVQCARVCACVCDILLLLNAFNYFD